MSSDGDRGLAMVLGVLGAVLIVVEGFVDLVRGAAFLVVGGGGSAVGSWSQAVLFLVLGVVLGAFALAGRSRGGDRGLAAGIVMVVIPLLGFALFGFLDGVLVLLGGVLVLIGGILYLVAAR